MMSTEADFQNSKCYQQMRGAGLSYTDFSFQIQQSCYIFTSSPHGNYDHDNENANSQSLVD